MAAATRSEGLMSQAIIRVAGEQAQKSESGSGKGRQRKTGRGRAGLNRT